MPPVKPNRRRIVHAQGGPVVVADVVGAVLKFLIVAPQPSASEVGPAAQVDAGGAHPNVAFRQSQGRQPTSCGRRPRAPVVGCLERDLVHQPGPMNDAARHRKGRVGVAAVRPIFHRERRRKCTPPGDPVASAEPLTTRQKTFGAGPTTASLVHPACFKTDRIRRRLEAIGTPNPSTSNLVYVGLGHPRRCGSQWARASLPVFAFDD